MHADQPPFEYRDHWLGKRRDGRSPEIWQIFWREGRSFPSRSTGCRDLELAKDRLIEFVSKKEAGKPQAPDETYVFSLLKLYWREHGSGVVSPGQIESSIKAFIGFLVSQPDLGAGATIDMLKPDTFRRFVEWRSREHTIEGVWSGKPFKYNSRPVKGETISRNLDDIKAALNHNQRMMRIQAPFVPPVDKSRRSPAKTLVFSLQELAAIVGYARMDNSTIYHTIALILATAARTEAAMAFDPAKQVNGDVIDLHPVGWRQTKKVNPVVPMIPELRSVISNWGAARVTSRKTSWRKMRELLELDPKAELKTIRHTVATMLLDQIITGDGNLTPMHIEALLGHRVLNRTTLVYAKWDIRHMEPLRPALSKIWNAVHQAADQWAAGHLLDTGSRGSKKKIIKTM